MLEVHLLVNAPVNWIRHAILEDSAQVRIMDVKMPKRGVTHNLVEVSSEKMRPEKLVSHLRQQSGVLASDLSKVGKDRVIGTVTTHNCPVCSTFSGVDCFLISAGTREDGKMEWELLLSGDENLKTLCRRLDRNNVRYEIVKVTHRLQKREITSRQEQILRIALDLGFFEFPKRIGLEELSSRLGISPGTLSEILRRAEKHVLSNYFKL